MCVLEVYVGSVGHGVSVGHGELGMIVYLHILNHVLQARVDLAPLPTPRALRECTPRARRASHRRQTEGGVATGGGCTTGTTTGASAGAGPTAAP